MNPLTKPRLDVSANLDREANQILQLEMKSRQIKEAPPRLEIN